MSKAKQLLNHSAARYFIVGLTAFGTDYAMLLLGYYALGLPLKIATTIGFFSGFLVSFIINKQWVFSGSQKKNTSRQVTEYLVLVGINYVFTVWAVSSLNSHGIKPAIGKLVVMALIMCWNYALFRWVIFAHQTEPNA